MIELDDAPAESSIVGIVLAGLPQKEYGQIIIILDMVPSLSYLELKEKITMYYKRKTSAKELSGNDGSTQALLTQEKKSTTKDWKSSAECFKCHKIGHVKRDCPLLKNEKKSDSGAKKEWRGSGAKSGFQEKKKVRWDSKTEKSSGPKENIAMTIWDQESSEFDWDAVEEEMRVAGHMITRFIVDSGATRHMVTSDECLTEVVPYNSKVKVAGGRTLEVRGSGTLVVRALDENAVLREIRIEEVLYVPELGVNLLSVPKMTAKGVVSSFTLPQSYLQVKSYMFPIMYDANQGLFRWQVGTTRTAKHEGVEDIESVPEAYSATVSTLEHDRLGHRGSVPGGCDVCELAKHKRISFPSEAEIDADMQPFELVYVDFLGPMEEETLAGARYAVIFVDRATGWIVVYCVSDKSCFLGCLQKFLQYVKTLGHQVKALWGRNPERPVGIWGPEGRVQELRSDRGGEFIGEDVIQYCRNKGIRQTFGGPYAPEQQGFVERRNGVLVGMTRAMLYKSMLPKSFWGEGLTSAAYISNRLPVAHRESPYEKIFGKKPKLDNLRVFGCKSFVHVPKTQMRKLDPRAKPGIMVGYDEMNWRSYRIYDPLSGKVRYAVHVTFHEDQFPDPAKMLEAAEEADEEYLRIVSAATVPNEQNEVEDLVRNNDVRDTESGEPRGGPQVPPVVPLLSREATLLDGENDQQATCAEVLPQGEPKSPWEMAMLASTSVMREPRTYREAMRSEYAKDWDLAMRDELNSLLINETWELVPRPDGVNVIGSRWVYTVKRDENGNVTKFKARYVARGYSQVPGYDFVETFSPVTRMDVIRLVICIAAILNLYLFNMDVKTAFLNAPVEEVIYVEQPPGFEKYGPNGEKLVCRMLKSLYGLKQSPRNWNRTIDEWLVDYGFEVSEADPCLYIKRTNNSITILVLWVDDVVIAGDCLKELNCFKREIADRFSMTDLGELSYILGIKVLRDWQAGTISLSQKLYVTDVLQKFGMEDCRPIGTPAEGCLMKSENTGPDQTYMSLVGSLLYASMVTRPDITFAVQSLGRHMQNSTEEHMAAAKRVLRYLKGTKDVCLVYGGSQSSENALEVSGFADADWGTDKETRRSVTGYVFMLGEGPVTWNSKLQQTVALSTTEAEYMALGMATQEAIYLRRILKSLGCEQMRPTVIHEDNAGCIAMSNNPVMHKRTKHIDIRYHFVRDAIARGDIALKYVPTDKQLADALTKAVPKPKIEYFRDHVMGVSKSQNV